MDLVKEKYRELVYGELVNALSKAGFPSFEHSSAVCSELSKFFSEFNAQVFEYLLGNAAAREENRKKLALSNVKVVSLGFNCLPRTVLTRWGVKPSRSEGEKTYPFDLAVHPTRVVAELIASDFLNYLNVEDFVNQNKIPRNPKVGVTFNHERGSNFIENDYGLLREKYSARVESFRHLKGVDSIFFVHHVKNEVDLSELVNSLVKFRGGSVAGDSLLVIKTDPSPFSDKVLAAPYEMDVDFLHAPVPHEKYVWHREEFYSSREGEEFERKISDFALNVILSRFKVVDRRVLVPECT